MRIEAKDLQSALTQASIALECSVIELEYEILQQPKAGFLGIGRKNAIIEACSKKRHKKSFKKESYKKFDEKREREEFGKDRSNFKDSKYTRENLESNSCEKKNYDSPRYSEKSLSEVKFTEKKNDDKEQYKTLDEKSMESEHKVETKIADFREKYSARSDKIFDSFHKESDETINTQDVLDEIRTQLETLIKSSCFNISLVELRMYDERCIFIKLDGEDAALMIGKEAHRYKALSYLLHNWINLKYNLLVRLEIAEFLENQMHGMGLYLESVIEKVKQIGRGQTKPLDGVLIKIALEQLRAEFPNKYVGIKQIGEQRIVVINDFLKK